MRLIDRLLILMLGVGVICAVWRLGNRPLVLVGNYQEIKTATERLAKGALPEALGMGVPK